MKLTYKHTTLACFIGFIVQAIVINYAPLLFLTLRSEYNIPLSKITFLVTFNFLTQLAVDFITPFFAEKLGKRAMAVGSQLFSCLGLVLFAVLPEIMNDAFSGLFIAVIIYAIGGGLAEVILNPIMEASPTENKEASMSLLHSFYCWGHVGVVLISTLFFVLFGIENWKILSFLWALIPLFNMFLFLSVPIGALLPEGQKELTLLELLKNKTFIIMVVIMLCAGASEQAVAQWASAFAEMGLGVDKTMGDLLGPMFFAIMMGSSRLLFSKYSEKLNLQSFIFYSCLLCVVSYLIISLSPIPFISLIGCGICGFSVGILWPGAISVSAGAINRGGTLMFALLALAGDMGCSAGPTLVGQVDSLQKGILISSVFPILLMICLYIHRKRQKAINSCNN